MKLLVSNMRLIESDCETNRTKFSRLIEPDYGKIYSKKD